MVGRDEVAEMISPLLLGDDGSEISIYNSSSNTNFGASIKVPISRLIIYVCTIASIICVSNVYSEASV
jgi:hypothetical protein